MTTKDDSKGAVYVWANPFIIPGGGQVGGDKKKYA